MTKLLVAIAAVIFGLAIVATMPWLIGESSRRKREKLIDDIASGKYAEVRK